MTTTGMNYRHSLIIGGTGMLEKAAHEICARSAACSVLARRASRFPLGDRIDVDYTDTPRFITTVQQQAARHGTPDLALLWLHRTGEESLLRLLPLLAGWKCRVVHVLGSASGDPRQQSGHISDMLKTLDLDYSRTILGHVGDRWLTHDEISQGALDTLTAAGDVIVGQI